MALMGKRFNYITMIQAKLQDTPADFQAILLMSSFKQWHGQRAHCTKSQGNYFEGDNIDQ
jgi:hypothetical protein